MTKPNRYVVQEALIIKKGTFTFKDNEGIAINLKKDVPIGKPSRLGRRKFQDHRRWQVGS